MTDITSANVATVLAKRLKAHGVEVVFGQSLPSALILAIEDEGILQYVYRTENAGGAMADGYARLSNKVGIVTAQNGPAAALLVAPLAEALKASIPVIALVQDVNTTDVGRNAFQELDHIALYAACTKWVRRLDDPHRAEDYLDRAIVAATTGRPGPSALLLPADILSATVDSSAPKRHARYGQWPMDRTVPDPQAVASAVDLLQNAARPIVIAGGGVHSAQATAALVRLQDEEHLPVAYTTMGKGCVSDHHPLTVGLVGNVMGKLSLGYQTRSMIDKADVVLLVGTRTNQNGTDSWRLLPTQAKIIHLDIDGNEVGRNYEPAVRLVGDAKLGLTAIAD